MPAILKIGYTHFLLKSEAAAMAAMKALGDALQVDHDFCPKTRQIVYFPAEESHRGEKELSLTIISQKQLRRSKPTADEPEIKEAKLLDYPGKVHYSA